MENRQNTKKKFFKNFGKKPEILMVLTLQFDKNLLRYITFNLQRLFRTVLVWHFNLGIYWPYDIHECRCCFVQKVPPN